MAITISYHLDREDWSFSIIFDPETEEYIFKNEERTIKKNKDAKQLVKEISKFDPRKAKNTLKPIEIRPIVEVKQSTKPLYINKEKPWKGPMRVYFNTHDRIEHDITWDDIFTMIDKDNSFIFYVMIKEKVYKRFRMSYSRQNRRYELQSMKFKDTIRLANSSKKEIFMEKVYDIYLKNAKMPGD